MKVFILVVNVAIGGAIILLFIGQILHPILRGTPLFPYFRKEKVLWDKLSEEKQKTVESNLMSQIKKQKRR